MKRIGTTALTMGQNQPPKATSPWWHKHRAISLPSDKSLMEDGVSLCVSRDEKEDGEKNERNVKI